MCRPIDLDWEATSLANKSALFTTAGIPHCQEMLDLLVSWCHLAPCEAGGSGKSGPISGITGDVPTLRPRAHSARFSRFQPRVPPTRWRLESIYAVDEAKSHF